MLKKIINSLMKNAMGKKKHYGSSDSWKKHKHHKHSSMGHHYYKRKHKSRSFSSFYSS
ncbi:hypothetical protein AB1K84_16890 [Mesobacillus foraminis]|uniref:hypothetical protein n=1 Tax=Mesobacillus foraminis TaxID=279826 RepID=UPI0013CE55F0|nr:hypothetical protein [Mesobacillus foraminis]MBT2757158.1 hypothetical protein [Mesobacillus foraminis]